MSDLADTYEFKERKAIRQESGCLDEIEAGQLALMDLHAREAAEAEEKKEAALHVPDVPDVPYVPDAGVCKGIDELRAERDRVGDEMRQELNAARKAELLAKWHELSLAIIEIKKGT